MEKVKLFCIPYSGGTADTYYKWKKYLDESIILCPIEIAGRGKRIKEGFYEDVDQAAEDIASIISTKLLKGEKYAIVGHSLGAVLAFETYYKLKEKSYHEPVHMIFTGRAAPCFEEEKTEYYKLPDKEFLDVVFSYGASTEELLMHKELLELFLPILRADFKIGETYKYEEKAELIKCDCTIINGSEDRSIIRADMKLWNKHMQKESDIRLLKGDHFFIIENIDETVDIINSKLTLT